MTLGEFFGLSREVLYGIAKIAYQLMNTGRADAALEIYKGLVAAAPFDSVFHCHLAAAHALRANHDLALRHFERSLEINLENGDALVGRAEEYLRRGKILEATADLDKAVRLDPQFSRASTQRARNLIVTLKQLLEREGQKHPELAKMFPASAPAVGSAKTSVPLGKGRGKTSKTKKTTKVASAGAPKAKAGGPPKRRGSSVFEAPKQKK